MRPTLAQSRSRPQRRWPRNHGGRPTGRSHVFGCQGGFPTASEETQTPGGSECPFSTALPPRPVQATANTATKSLVARRPAAARPSAAEAASPSSSAAAQQAVPEKDDQMMMIYIGGGGRGRGAARYHPCRWPCRPAAAAAEAAAERGKKRIIRFGLTEPPAINSSRTCFRRSTKKASAGDARKSGSALADLVTSWIGRISRIFLTKAFLATIGTHRPLRT